MPYGKWCVVTGATEGIGKAYARAFARRGMSVLLIARTTAKLEKVAQEIRHEFNVEVEYSVFLVRAATICTQGF